VKVFRNVVSGFGTVGELLQLLVDLKRWWLIPFVITLLALGGLLLVGQATGVAPFIYTLF
jgi:hypothetical protein